MTTIVGILFYEAKNIPKMLESQEQCLKDPNLGKKLYKTLKNSKRSFSEFLNFEGFEPGLFDRFVQFKLSFYTL